MRRNCLLICLATLVLAASANADITPVLSSVTPSGSDFSWNYTISVDAAEQLVGGNYGTCDGGVTPCGTFFTIYDFVGFVSVSGAPTDWGSDSSQLVGVTPPNVLRTDSPSIINVTFNYTGATAAGPITNLGGFSILSTYGTQNPLGEFAAQAQKLDSTVDQAVGYLAVPSPPTSVPEAGYTSSLLIGLGGLVFVASRRYSKVS